MSTSVVATSGLRSPEYPSRTGAVNRDGDCGDGVFALEHAVCNEAEASRGDNAIGTWHVKGTARLPMVRASNVRGIAGRRSGYYVRERVGCRFPLVNPFSLVIVRSRVSRSGPMP